MPARCQLCEKTPAFGRNIRHKSSGRWQRKAHRTPRMYRPNLHRQMVWMDGRPQKLTLCTRCLRSQTKLPR